MNDDKAPVVQGRKTKTKKGERPRFNLAKAVMLRLKGNTLEDISKLLGVRLCTTQYHFGKLQAAFQDPEVLQLYEKNRGDFLKSLQLTVGTEIFDRKKLSKASVNNLAYAYRQFYDCGRLEEGRSTANVSYADIIRQKEEVEAELRELQDEDKK